MPVAPDEERLHALLTECNQLIDRSASTAKRLRQETVRLVEPGSSRRPLPSSTPPVVVSDRGGDPTKLEPIAYADIRQLASKVAVLQERVQVLERENVTLRAALGSSEQ